MKSTSSPPGSSVWRKPRAVIAFLVTLLCLVPCIKGLQVTSVDDARRAAATTDDKSATLKGRQEALTKLQEASQFFLSAGETIEAAKALNRIGRLQLVLNEPDAALASHNQALELLKEKADSGVAIDNLNGLAAAHLRLRHRKEAESFVRQSLQQSEDTNYRKGQAEALLIRSNLENYQNHAVGLQTAQKALSIWQELDDKVGLARTYSQIGQCHLAQDQLPDSERNYQSALRLYRDIGNNSGQAGALVSLGFIEFRKGGLQEAIAYHTQAQELIDDEAEPTRMGQVAAGLAEAFNESGLPEVGERHFIRVLEYYLKTKDPEFIAFAMWGLGCSYYLQGKYEAAITQFNDALALVDADSIQAAQCHEYLGRVSIATQKYADARKHLLTAIASYKLTLNPKEAAQAEGLLGKAYEMEGQISTARLHYEQALTAFQNLSDKVNESASLFALGRLELQTGQYDLAENHLRQSIDVTEQIRRRSLTSDLGAAFSATVHNRYESFIECLMRKNQTQPAPTLTTRAFEASEAGRGRSLAELLSATQTNLTSGFDPELAKQEKTLRQELRVKEDLKIVLLSKTYKKEELDSFNAELSTLETKYEQVRQAIKQRYPNYEQITQPVAWDLPRIQADVVAADDTVLLEYSLGDERSYLWEVTRHQITSHELPARSVINKAAQNLSQLLATRPEAGPDPKLTQATRELSKLVLSPVAALLNKRRIIVVADGALNYIPFQMLTASPSNDEPVVATAEVINTPSASILGQLREETSRRPAPTKVLAAFGDPIFVSNYPQRKETSGSEYVAAVKPVEGERWRQALRDVEGYGKSVDPAALQPLIYSIQELAHLRTMAGPETLMLTGFAATREKLASLDLSNYAILHFATHGVLDPQRPANSGFFLSMVDQKGRAHDGFVGLQDIYSLQAPVDLVVLSACRTGLGKEVLGEGLIGLTRGFMYAGASSVVASLWEVDDEATAELMKEFYANMLQRDKTPASALRDAQNSIRQRPEWRSPYYWAAFTLQGESNKTIKVTPPRRVPVGLLTAIGLSLILLLAGALWYRRFRLARNQR